MIITLLDELREQRAQLEEQVAAFVPSAFNSHNPFAARQAARVHRLEDLNRAIAALEED